MTPQYLAENMMTADRLDEVREAVGRIAEARRAVEDLCETEPTSQPPTIRESQERRIARSLGWLELELAKLYV